MDAPTAHGTYGQRSFADLYDTINRHRRAVRAEGSAEIQDSWDLIEPIVDVIFAEARRMGAAAPDARG